MRKTTMEMKSLQARMRNSDDVLQCPDINSHSLLEHFHAFVASAPEKGIKDEEHELYLRITDVKCAGCYVLVKTESGTYGDNGNVYEVDTGRKKYGKAYGESMTTGSRVIFFLPPGADRAMVAVEKNGSSKGYALFYSFIEQMKQRYHSFIYRSGNVYEEDSWAQYSKLTEVEVLAYKKQMTYRSGLESHTFTATLGHSLTPPKGERYLPDSLKQALLNRKLDAVSMLEVPEDLDRKVTLTLEHDGRQKKFEVGKQGTPLFREILTDDGDLPLDDAAFIRRASESVADYYRALGLQWSSDYEIGEWDGTSLDFTWDEV